MFSPCSAKIRASDKDQPVASNSPDLVPEIFEFFRLLDHEITINLCTTHT